MRRISKTITTDHQRPLDPLWKCILRPVLTGILSLFRPDSPPGVYVFAILNNSIKVCVCVCDRTYAVTVPVRVCFLGVKMCQPQDEPCPSSSARPISPEPRAGFRVGNNKAWHSSGSYLPSACIDWISSLAPVSLVEGWLLVRLKLVWGSGERKGPLVWCQA